MLGTRHTIGLDALPANSMSNDQIIRTAKHCAHNVLCCATSSNKSRRFVFVFVFNLATTHHNIEREQATSIVVATCILYFRYR